MQSSGKSVERDMCVNKSEIAFLLQQIYLPVQQYCYQNLLCTNGHLYFNKSGLKRIESRGKCDREQRVKSNSVMTLFSFISQVESVCDAKSTNGFMGNGIFSRQTNACICNKTTASERERVEIAMRVKCEMLRPFSTNNKSMLPFSPVLSRALLLPSLLQNVDGKYVIG